MPSFLVVGRFWSKTRTIVGGCSNEASIGIMVKNEEAHLRNCLGALMPLLEELSGEIVVLDTGSTDSSKEIAIVH